MPRPEPRFPLHLLTASIATGMLAVIAIAWSTTTATSLLVAARDRYTKAETHCGNILLYDEILTMSARQAVAMGLKRAKPQPVHYNTTQNFWAMRYDDADRALNKSLNALLKLLAFAPKLRTHAALTSDANEHLITIERQALRAHGASQLAAAQDALNSPRYAQLKQQYAEQMKALRQQLTTRFAYEVERQSLRVRVVWWMTAILCLLMAASWAYLMRSLMGWRKALMAAKDRLAELRVSDNTTLMRDLLRSEQRERTRLRGLLHDDLQQYLVAARMRLALIRDARPSKTDDAILLAIELIDNAQHSARTLMSRLHAPPLDEVGIVEAIQQLVVQMEAIHAMRIPLLAPASIPPLQPTIAMLAYTSIRELLLNVAKHANTKHANISIQYKDDTLQIQVVDLGCGFNPNQPASSGGLLDLRQRILAVGGTFILTTQPTQGTQATLEIPHTQNRTPSRSSTPQDHTRTPQKIFIVDDNDLVRQQLREQLVRDTRFEVVGEASDGIEAVDAVGTLKPDWVIMDYAMPNCSGAEATRRIHQKAPSILIVGYSALESSTWQQDMLDAGASATASKNGDIQNLLDIISKDTI